jgi:hypothetical protein
MEQDLNQPKHGTKNKRRLMAWHSEISRGKRRRASAQTFHHPIVTAASSGPLQALVRDRAVRLSVSRSNREAEKHSYAWQIYRINDVLHRVHSNEVLVVVLEKSRTYQG